MQNENEAPEDREVEAAPFADRVVAFSLDYALFAALFFLSMKLAFPSHPPLLNPHGMKWAFLWMALFVLYSAWFSSEGRVSLGKRLLGLRVVTLDGEPLSLTQGAGRSAGYLLSAIGSLGFLWMLANRAKQTWHDILVGSIVVVERPRAPGASRLIQAAAAVCLLAFTGVWTWEHVIAETYYRSLTVAHAHVGLREIGALEKLYFGRYGRYADNLIPLAILSGSPEAFMGDMAKLFDSETGVSIEVSERQFTIRAKARDADHTPVKLVGP